MVCPYCHTLNSHQVVESRATRQYIRRRRKCLACKNRFTTRESLAEATEAKLLKEDRRSATKSFRLLREDHATLWENQTVIIGLLRRVLKHVGADDDVVGLIMSLQRNPPGGAQASAPKGRKKVAA